MNGIEKITDRLDAEASARVDSILAEAKKSAGQITERSNAEIERLREDLRNRGDKDAAEREERLTSVAQMEARQLMLRAKQEMMELAFDKALDQLCGASDEAYAAVCTKLLVKAAPDGKGEAIFAADRQKAGELAIAEANKQLGNGSLTVSKEQRPIKGGFILKNGSVEVNCTYETLVRLQRTEAAQDVAKLLFPEA